MELLKENWVKQSRVHDKMIGIKVLIQGIKLDIPIYVPQCCLSESEKRYFHNRLISVASKFGENYVVFIAGAFSGHVGS